VFEDLGSRALTQTLRNGQATFDEMWQIIDLADMSMDELTGFVVQIETNADLNLHTDTWKDVAVERRDGSVRCDPCRTTGTAGVFNHHRTVQALSGLAIAPLQRRTRELPSVDHLFYYSCPSITASTSL